MAVFDDDSPHSSDETFQRGLDTMRQRFASTFVAQCDSIRILVEKVAALHPRGPVAAGTTCAFAVAQPAKKNATSFRVVFVVDALGNNDRVAGLESEIQLVAALQRFFVIHWNPLLLSSFVAQYVDLLRIRKVREPACA